MWICLWWYNHIYCNYYDKRWIRCQQDVVFVWSNLFLEYLLSLLLDTLVRDLLYGWLQLTITYNLQTRSPLFKLIQPIGESTKGNNDEIGSSIILVLYQISNQSDGLNGFSKTHFISQDTIQIVDISINEDSPGKNTKRLTIEDLPFDRVWECLLEEGQVDDQWLPDSCERVRSICPVWRPPWHLDHLYIKEEDKIIPAALSSPFFFNTLLPIKTRYSSV